MNEAKEKAMEWYSKRRKMTIKEDIKELTMDRDDWRNLYIKSQQKLQEQAKEMIEVIERNLCIERMGSYDNIEGQMDWKGFKEKYGGKEK